MTIAKAQKLGEDILDILRQHDRGPESVRDASRRHGTMRLILQAIFRVLSDDHTPPPQPLLVGTLESASEAVRRYVEGKEWGGGKFSMHDVGWNERVADCLANIRAGLAAEGERND